VAVDWASALGSVGAVAAAGGYALRLVGRWTDDVRRDHERWWTQQGKMNEAITEALRNHLAHDEENLRRIADRLDRQNDVLVRVAAILDERRK